MSFKQNNSSNSINISDWKNIIYDFKPKISIIDSDYSIEETLKSQFVKLVILDTTKITSSSINYCKKECSLVKKPILALITKEMTSTIHLEKE